MKNKKRRLKIKKLPLPGNSPPNRQKLKKKRRFRDLPVSMWWWALVGWFALLLVGEILFLPERPPVAVAPPATEEPPPVCLRLNGYTIGDRIDTAYVATDTTCYDAAGGNGQAVLQKQPLLTAQVQQHHIVELEQILSAIELEITIQFVNRQLAQKPVFAATHAADNLSGSYHWRYGDVSVTLERGQQKGKWTLRVKKAP